MKYYIDFDNTLFDSEKFYQDLLKIAESFGLSKIMIDECYQDNFSNELFNPFKVIEYLIEKSNINKEINKEIKKLLINAKKYLYDDTILFLEFLKKENFSLILLTYGDVSYQKAKIKETEINEYFDQIIITSKLKGELGLDYRKSVFLDDNVEQIKSLLKKDAKVIRIRRRGNKHSLDNIDGIFECEDLKKLQLMIENKLF